MKSLILAASLAACVAMTGRQASGQAYGYQWHSGPYGSSYSIWIQPAPVFYPAHRPCPYYGWQASRPYSYWYWRY